MSKKIQKNKKNQKRIALNRMQKLFQLAHSNAIAKNFELADRYVFIARKISMKYLVPIPAEFKRRFCKHCYSYLLPSVNSRYRIHDKRLVIFCFNCKKYTRFPLKNKEK